MISSLSYYSNLLGSYLSVDSTSFEDLIPKVERITSDVELEGEVEAVALQALPPKSEKPSRLAYKVKRRANRDALKALKLLAENGDGAACFRLFQYYLLDPDAKATRFVKAKEFLNRALNVKYRIAVIAGRFIDLQGGTNNLNLPAVRNVLVTMHPTDENKIDKRLR